MINVKIAVEDISGLGKIVSCDFSTWNNKTRSPNSNYLPTVNTNQQHFYQ